MLYLWNFWRCQGTFLFSAKLGDVKALFNTFEQGVFWKGVHGIWVHGSMEILQLLLRSFCRIFEHFCFFPKHLGLSFQNGF